MTKKFGRIWEIRGPPSIVIGTYMKLSSFLAIAANFVSVFQWYMVNFGGKKITRV